MSKFSALLAVFMAAMAMATGASLSFKKLHQLKPMNVNTCSPTFFEPQVMDMVARSKRMRVYVKSDLQLLKERLQKCPSSKPTVTGVTFTEDGLLGDIWNFLVDITMDLQAGTIVVTQDLINIVYDFLQTAIIIPTALAEFIVQWLFWLLDQLIGLCPHCEVPGSTVTIGTSTTTYPEEVSTATFDLTTPYPDEVSTLTSADGGGTSTATYPPKMM